MKVHVDDIFETLGMLQPEKYCTLHVSMLKKKPTHSEIGTCKECKRTVLVYYSKS